MKRRDLIKSLGAGSLLAGGLAACSRPSTDNTTSDTKAEKLRWNMVTTWPKNFPGLGSAAEYLAKSITELSGGRLSVHVYGAGERVPALEIFDAVARGAAEMGHGAAYYWKGKSPAAPFFTSVPFGLTAQEMNGWLYFGGGLELWRELYAPFNLIPFEAGNTGTQMGGWFRREIRSLADLKGLKMRIPGLGGEVLQRLGVTTINIPGGELFTAMQSGTIDATEWVGPYNDLAFGLHKTAKYYYYPGWQEPGPTLECIVNKQAFEGLPEDLQSIVRIACQATGANMLAEYAGRNQAALETLVNDHGVKLLPFPDDVMQALREASAAVLKELVGNDPFSRKVYDSVEKFRKSSIAATAIAEKAYLDMR
jgi:TRAP-type mannitol/chloroaromatic compound transport system substrate-binding protein